MGNIFTKKTKINLQSESELESEQLSEEDLVINMIVDRYLKDEHINNKFIPDVVEKRIYRNILRLITGLAKDTLGHANIQILGHQINFNITPIVPSTNEVVTKE